jgi:hypothetical protein
MFLIFFQFLKIDHFPFLSYCYACSNATTATTATTLANSDLYTNTKESIVQHFGYFSHGSHL